MKTLSLAGEWTMKRLSTGETIPAQVPGDTHSALLAAGKIPDPYWGTNELDLQWIGREDWLLSREFEAGQDLLAASSVFLNCDQIDTISELSINGRKAGATSNMFTRHRFEVGKLLKPGRNTIEILLKSAEAAAVAAAKKLPYPIPHGNNPVQSPHRNLVRKVQCHSGWDWGPCLMVAGVYGDLSLRANDLGRIEHVYTTQKHKNGSCSVEVACEFECAKSGTSTLEVELDGVSARKSVTLQPGLNIVKAAVKIDNPKLWWPLGHGAQPLYTLTARLGGDQVKKRVGLRIMELVNKDDKIGRSMVFRVNGVDIFCKGADWIPCDALPQRQTRAVLDDLLDSAAAAGMNMLRIWGGGQYEVDDFYDLCDEKGLMVWQDFMFACALYPATKEFLASVKAEAEYQVKRLRDHACLALWCGDNENIGALNWFKESREGRDRYLVDYDRLNHGTLGKAVEECDPTRSFWPSSPCAGPNDFSDTWHKDGYGDMHYWEVWHGSKPFEDYYRIKPRFCSEFGFQSFPSLETIRTYAPESEFNLTSTTLEHHQRNVGGNSRIIQTISLYFRMPSGLKNFLYLSQLQQGLALKTGIEHWRRLRPTCMGTLYWQINDNWPVCSWATVEYGGKWKLSHYLAKRFYNETHAAALPQGDAGIDVWLVNDAPAAKKVRLAIEVIDFAGKTSFSEKLDVDAPAGSSTCLKSYETAKLTAAPTGSFMLLTWDVDGKTSYNEKFFVPYKRCALPEAKVNFTPRKSGDALEVELSTDLPAFFVSLNATGVKGEFDDNCLTLLPGRPRTLRFTPKGQTTFETFTKSLGVTHLAEACQ